MFLDSLHTFLHQKNLSENACTETFFLLAACLYQVNVINLTGGQINLFNLFRALSVCGLCMKYLGNHRKDLCQIHAEDVIGPSLRQV